MSDQTITIANADIVDAMSSSRQDKDEILVSDAEGLRVYGVDAMSSSRQIRTESSFSDAEGLRVYGDVIVTVKATGRSAYTYCVRAARRLSWFITVKARAFAVVVESRVRAFLMNVFPKTGADILRQSAILNI